MRIVHEVYVPMNPSGGLDGRHHASVFATEASPLDHPNLSPAMFGGKEVIEIEGDPEYLINLLEGWLKCLRSAQSAKERENVMITRKKKWEVIIEFRNADRVWESYAGPFKDMKTAQEYKLPEIQMPDGSMMQFRIVSAV